MTYQEMHTVSISKVMRNKNKVAFDEILHSIHQFHRYYFRTRTRPLSGYALLDYTMAMDYFEEFDILKTMNS